MAGVGDLLALFRCVSVRYRFSTDVMKPTLMGAIGRVYSTLEVRRGVWSHRHSLAAARASLRLYSSRPLYSRSTLGVLRCKRKSQAVEGTFTGARCVRPQRTRPVPCMAPMQHVQHHKHSIQGLVPVVTRVPNTADLPVQAPHAPPVRNLPNPVSFPQPEMSHNVQKYDKQVYLRVSEAQRCRVHSTLMVPIFGSEARDSPLAVFELVQGDKDVTFPAVLSQLSSCLQASDPHETRACRRCT